MLLIVGVKLGDKALAVTGVETNGRGNGIVSAAVFVYPATEIVIVLLVPPGILSVSSIDPAVPAYVEDL